MSTQYPKRIIEVDLPIARISAHARREKSIRHGHISTLHIWWARRPLAACRAVICAALWPDPEDLTAWLRNAEREGGNGPMGPEIRAPLHCESTEGVLIRPQRFLKEATDRIRALAEHFCTTKRGHEELLADLHKELRSPKRSKRLSAEAERDRRFAEWEAIRGDTELEPATLRRALLTLIAWCAGWEQSTMRIAIETTRALTQAAHESLGGVIGTRPFLADPFAGGGAIPLEALRVGAEAFASDLNPLAVLLNQVLLEQLPQAEDDFNRDFRKRGADIKSALVENLSEYYPADVDGAVPIAYLWARVILSEGPQDVDGQGEVLPPIEVPLVGSFWLSKRPKRRRALRWLRDSEGKVKTRIVDRRYADGTSRRVRQPLLEVFEPRSEEDVATGTIARYSATCPVTNFTTRAPSVRKQLSVRCGGSADARLLCVVLTHCEQSGRTYRIPTKEEESINDIAAARLSRQFDHLIPREPTPEGKGGGAGRAFSMRNFGMTEFQHLYTPRQLLALCTITEQLRSLTSSDRHLMQILSSFALGRVNDLCMTLCRWLPSIEALASANGGQNRMPVVPDFAEANPIGGAGGDWEGQVDWIARVVEHVTASQLAVGSVQQAPAQKSILPEDSIDALVTDPPYYDAFPYSDLSDFFHIWILRALDGTSKDAPNTLVPKDDEIVVYDVIHGDDGRVKDKGYFCSQMTAALEQSRLAAKPSAIGTVVFANKTTEGWEALIQSIIDAGWVATASWPVDTERANRQRAIDSAALGSSVHVVCRPRESASGALETSIGEWREVLTELPERIHAWMPRLAQEGVVGADAIFACLGPALEIFSRYSRVEKASGEVVTLGEYLEQVWAAVSKEALSLLFEDADASGLEPDARLTAMWLWTLGAGAGVKAATKKGAAAALGEGDVELESAEEEATNGKKSGGRSGGYELEFDAARKIAQGLGAHLDKLSSVVEIKGDKARLLGVGERTRHLFGKDAEAGRPRGRRKKKDSQFKLDFAAELEAAEEEAEASGWSPGATPMGQTTLDRIHQSMILFAAGRGEALKRFLIEDGAGKDARFWKLAQSLSALYPPGTDEKRWVDGVLGRKKGLGL